MPYLRDDEHLDQFQRALRAANVVIEGKDASVRYIREVTFDILKQTVIASDNYDDAPLVRITTDSGETYDVCPWCKAIHEREVFDNTGLFFHGSCGRIYACNRPSLIYTYEECGQPGYGRDWDCG